MSVGFCNTHARRVGKRGKAMKTDPRVRYTRMIIRTSFLELLQEKPVSKITVREICERSEINRSTFYKHYQDCYDLMDKLKEETLARFDELMAGIEGSGAQSALLAILQTLKNNAQLVHLIAPDGGGGEFTHQIIQRCYRYMDLHLTVSPALGWNEAQKGISYAFLRGGVVSVIEHWVQDGCKEPPEQVSATIMDLCKILAVGLAGE